MQTTRQEALWLAVVASLLWIIPTQAATRGATGQKIKSHPKVHYIGTASWYGIQHQGRKMANGKRFDRHKLTAASWYYPLGTMVRVVNVSNGKSVIVTVTDRGPNLRLNRIIDLSEAAAGRLEYVGEGLTQVFIYPVPPVDTQSASFDTGLTEPEMTSQISQLETKPMISPM